MTVRLAMTILARDEADVIEDNIRYHAALGVDYFVVTDNGSKDGTRDILTDLKADVDLHIIDEPSKTIDQDLWVTRMTSHIRDGNHADWVVLNDADEIWHCEQDSLKDSIPAAGPDQAPAHVLRCARFNMLPSTNDIQAPDYRFFRNVWKVAGPLGEWPRKNQTEEPDYPFLLGKIGPKIMCEVSGLRAVGMGNHTVEHESGRAAPSERITIYHFPVRTFDQFETKVRNYGESLIENERFSPRVSSHFRDWYDLYVEGKLRDEYDSFVLDDERLSALKSQGVIERDETVLHAFED